MDYDITFVVDYRYKTIINKNLYTTIEGHITNVNYKNIDNYYNNKDFLSQQLLTSNQVNEIIRKNIEGFEFVYHSRDTDVYINGYNYIN